MKKRHHDIMLHFISWVRRSVDWPLFRKLRSNLWDFPYIPTSHRKLQNPQYYDSRRLVHSLRGHIRSNYMNYPFCNLRLSRNTELCFDSIAWLALSFLVTKVFHVSKGVLILNSSILLQRLVHILKSSWGHTPLNCGRSTLRTKKSKNPCSVFHDHWKIPHKIPCNFCPRCHGWPKMNLATVNISRENVSVHD